MKTGAGAGAEFQTERGGGLEVWVWGVRGWPGPQTTPPPPGGAGFLSSSLCCTLFGKQFMMYCRVRCRMHNEQWRGRRRGNCCPIPHQWGGGSGGFGGGGGRASRAASGRTHSIGSAASTCGAVVWPCVCRPRPHPAPEQRPPLGRAPPSRPTPQSSDPF